MFPRMVYWLSHDPSLYGICLFILPLFLLPVLASTYAEVNYFGSLIIKVCGKILNEPSTLPCPAKGVKVNNSEEKIKVVDDVGFGTQFPVL